MRPDDVKRALDALASEVPAPERGAAAAIARAHRRITQRRFALVGVAALLVAAVAIVGTVTRTGPNAHPESSLHPQTTTRNAGPTSPPATSATTPAPIPEPAPEVIAVSSSEIWICSSPPLYSADGGATWQRFAVHVQAQTDPSVQTPLCAARPGGNAWVLSAGPTPGRPVVNRIHDGEVRSFGFGPLPTGAGVVALTFSDAEHGWALTSAGTPHADALDLYRTSDGGERWAIVAHRPPIDAEIDFGSGAQHMQFTNADDGWAVPGGPASTRPHLERTTDGGRTWYSVRIPTGAGDESVPAPTISSLFADGDTIVVSGARPAGMQYQPVFDVSTDAGRTWSPPAILRDFELGKNPSPQVAMVDARHWRILSSDLWLTDDGGLTWQHRPVLSRLHLGAIEPEWMSFATPDRGWITAATYPAGSSIILRTTDGGRTWTEVTPAPPPARAPAPAPDARLTAPSQLAFPSATEGWISGRPFLYADNFGSAPERVAIPIAPPVTTAGKQASQQPLCAAAPGGYAWLLRGTIDPQRPELLRIRPDGSEPPVSLIRIPPATIVDSISFVDADHGWAVVTYESSLRRDLYVTDDGGASWTALEAHAPIIGDVIFTDANRGWASAAAAGKLATTDDGGRTWRVETIPVLHSSAYTAGVAPVYARGDTIVVSGELPTGNFAEPFYDVSTDGGNTWSLRAGPKDTEVPGTLSHPFSAADADHWALGFGNVLYVTDDGGRSWTRRAPVAGLDEMWYIARVSPDVAFVSGIGDPRTQADVVLRSTDGLRTWSQLVFTAQPSTAPDVATPGAIVNCPGHAITPPPASDVRSAVANAAINDLERTNSWGGGTVTAVRPVGETGAAGRWNTLATRVRACGSAVADAAWLVELRADSEQIGVAGSLSAVVLTHHADGWHVFGRTT